MIADECLTFNLKHGVKLTIRNTSGQLNITSVADFLNTAIEHFKQLRDHPTVSSLSEGPFGGEIIEGQTSLGEIQLSLCHYQTAPASMWTDSVVDAFSRTNTLEQIRDDLPAWQKQISREPNGYLHEVIRFLSMPNGEFKALSVMLSRSTR